MKISNIVKNSQLFELHQFFSWPYFSPDATTDSSTASAAEGLATSPKTSHKSSKVKELLEKPASGAMAIGQPKVMLIPIVKISPAAENEQHLQLPKATTNRDLKKTTTENNQLLVPNVNGRSVKRRESVENIENDESNYGSTTLRVNPFDKSCITQVADMQRAKNTVDFVTCSTCFPIFHRMKIMKRRSS